MIVKNIMGQKFGRLTVVEFVGNEGKGQANKWRCVCDCGSSITTITASLIAGRSTSCGCKRGEKLTTHGESSRITGQTPLYAVWQAMRQRCKNPNNRKYPIYGGKGVRVCQEWDKYEGFKDWAESSGYEKGLSIDRVDSDGHYEPKNCRWITLSENSRRGTINRNRIHGNPGIMVHSDDLTKL